MREFLLVNQSTQVTAKEANAMAAAISQQVKKDFCPAWGRMPIPVRAGTLASAKLDAYVVFLMDSPDEPGALGYHTEEGDRELAKVFVDPVLKSGGVVLLDPKNHQTPTVASVVSHEVLELMGDPFVNLWVDGPATKAGSSYSLEVCDPVEQDQYVIKGVAVSNFVYPEWFNQDTTSRADQYDFLDKLTAPFTMTAGGYMMVRKRSGSGSEVFAKNRQRWRTKAKATHPTSRTNKRTGRA